MSSTAREYLILVEESAYGTPVASPVMGTSKFLIPLVESNSFTASEDPVFNEIAYGGGFDVVADVVSDQRESKGKLNTLGYPGLTAWLLNAAVTRINAGQTAPWTTTEPPGDIVSFGAWHVYRGRDGATVTKYYKGGKILGVQGTISRSDPKLKLSVDVQFSKELPNAHDSSTAPSAPAAPTEADYPRGPYLFSHTSGNVMLGGVAKTQYSDLSFSVTNKCDPQWYESVWLQTLGCYGREATADVNFLLKSTTDLRATYQALTSQGFSVKFDNGTNSTELDFNGNAHINKLANDFPLGKEFMQKATFRNKWDAAANAGAGGDLTVTSA